MAEPLFLLMYEVQPRAVPQDPSGWFPMVVDDRRALTADEAEYAALQVDDGRPRFLMLTCDENGHETEAGRSFGHDSQMTLAMLPGDTIWNYGVPVAVDLLRVLREVWETHTLPSMPSPDPDRFPIPAAEAIELARARFGDGDTEVIERAFEWMLDRIGGRKHVEQTAPADDGLPPATVTVYLVPLSVLGVKQ